MIRGIKIELASSGVVLSCEKEFCVETTNTSQFLDVNSGNRESRESSAGVEDQLWGKKKATYHRPRNDSKICVARS